MNIFCAVITERGNRHKCCTKILPMKKHKVETVADRDILSRLDLMPRDTEGPA